MQLELLAEQEWRREFVGWAEGHPLLAPADHEFVQSIRKNYVEREYTRRASNKQKAWARDIEAKAVVEPDEARWFLHEVATEPGDMSDDTLCRGALGARRPSHWTTWRVAWSRQGSGTVRSVRGSQVMRCVAGRFGKRGPTSANCCVTPCVPARSKSPCVAAPSRSCCRPRPMSVYAGGHRCWSRFCASRLWRESNLISNVNDRPRAISGCEPARGFPPFSE